MTNDKPEQPHELQRYGQQPDGQQPFPQAPKTNTLAIISLVSAFFVSLAAIITGHIALGQIKRSGESGRGLALAGLILGYAGAAAKIMIVILAIVFAATIGAILVAVNTSTSGAPPSSNSPIAPIAPSAPSADSLPDIPTGQLGAAHFDDGYLAVGTGATIVDVYLDPICPFCRQFETTNGDQLAGLVADGDITLRLHSLTFLDWASQGTNYSSRASAALTCQATLNPAGTLDYLATLYANQPGENTVGLGDDELVALADGTGGTSIANCVADGEYLLWSQLNTENALNGPIPDAEITSVEGTPTVLVNGALYPGSPTDAQMFAAFLAAN